VNHDHHPRSFAGLEKDKAMNASLTFPDGSVREYDAAMTGAALAESISKSLAKKSVAYVLNGEVRDLCDPLGTSGSVEIMTREDKRALELIRHDCAHVMAEGHRERFLL
jgi:threonyl-tRNA synthetase